MQYPLGKTPLSVRIARYVEWFAPQSYIPIHPTEYWKLMATNGGYKELQGLSALYGIPVVPLGHNQ